MTRQISRDFAQNESEQYHTSTTKMKSKKRCAWVDEKDELMVKYHDLEWGRPVRDSQKLFEFLVLESAQAGLSWRTVLHKRENYRKAFARFNPKKVSKFGKKEVARLLKNSGIIRNRAKIEAAINNAKCFLAVEREFGSFTKYSWSFIKNKTIKHKIRKLKDYPPSIPEAEHFAEDLKKRGFKFLGPTTVYAHMQAVGMADDHMANCFCRNK